MSTMNTMGSYLIPSLLRPDFTWSRPMGPISKTTPRVPQIPSRTERLAWGFLHRALRYFSRWYCSGFGVSYDYNIVELPFGLVIKWTGRIHMEEAVAMQMARAAGMPVPKLLCCGEHPNDDLRTFSILMTRLPGLPLNNSGDLFEPDNEDPWVHELKECVDAMRCWTPPDPSAICSPIGTAIHSSRVPNHIMGPFPSNRELYDYLFSPSSDHAFKSRAKYEETVVRAEKLRQAPCRITFSHGDFKAHNILVDDEGHLSGFLDWESGGWYPEYWEFTTAMRFGRGSWWFQIADWMGGNEYREELDADMALNSLTVDSYICF